VPFGIAMWRRDILGNVVAISRGGMMLVAGGKILGVFETQNAFRTGNILDNPGSLVGSPMLRLGST